MKNKSMIIVGVFLIIGAIVAAVASQEVPRRYIGDAEMRGMADILQYTGLGAGAVGVVLLLAGLIKKEQ